MKIQFRTPVYQQPAGGALYLPGTTYEKSDVTDHALSFEKNWYEVKESTSERKASTPKVSASKSTNTSSKEETK